MQYLKFGILHIYGGVKVVDNHSTPISHMVVALNSLFEVECSLYCHIKHTSALS